jgi:hypothetical protein
MSGSGTLVEVTLESLKNMLMVVTAEKVRSAARR